MVTDSSAYKAMILAYQNGDDHARQCLCAAVWLIEVPEFAKVATMLEAIGMADASESMMHVFVDASEVMMVTFVATSEDSVGPMLLDGPHVGQIADAGHRRMVDGLREWCDVYHLPMPPIVDGVREVASTARVFRRLIEASGINVTVMRDRGIEA
ncbi:MAG: hypothetical protein A2Y38_23710 [Spirochaetes bacterium GWB1_59_5]|nr:MAG: hypothetical protein A2Y38_23710 [Spirochaetes bacterium GWB1_59_5]